MEQNRSALERERSDCAAARRTYEEKAARQDALAYQNAAALCSRSCLGPTFSEYQIFQDLGSKDALQNERLYAACFGEISLLPPISVSCSVRGEHGEVYKTTLKSCTCKDYQVRRHPCKHMYYLALRLGLLSTVNEAAVMDAIDDIHAALGQIASERKDLAADQRSLAREQQKLNERARQEASVQKKFLRSLDTYGYNPDWLAKLYADFHAQFDAELVEHLRERAPWMELVHGDAGELVSLLQERGIEQVDAVISSIPWTLLEDSEQDRILRQVARALVPHGAFTALTYLPAEHNAGGRRFRVRLGRTFDEVLTHTTWRNFPPIMHYICRRPLI